MGSENAGLSRIFREYRNNEIITLHYNYTGKLQASRYQGGLKTEAVVFLFICTLIVLENLVVLIAIWKNKKFHSPMYFLLGNLTLSDLLAGVAYAVNIIMSGSNTLKLTPLLWFFREGGVFITLTASVVSLLAIAIERHVTMVKMKLYHEDKKGRMFALISASWVLSIGLGVLPIVGWNCLQELERCSTILPLYSKNYILFCISVFIVVLLSILVLYVKIYRIVKLNSQRFGSQRKGVARKSQKHMALLRTLTTVVGTFIACWLPLFILFLLDVSCQVLRCGILYKADYFLGLAMLNSLLNPIIYTLTSKDMRKAILKLLCKCLLNSRDGKVKRFLDWSTSKSEKSSHRLEGMEVTVSSGNAMPSPIKPLYPKTGKS